MGAIFETASITPRSSVKTRPNWSRHGKHDRDDAGEREADEKRHAPAVFAARGSPAPSN